MQDGSYRCFELGLLALHARPAQADKAKGDQPHHASPTTLAGSRPTAYRRQGGVGPGARWRDLRLAWPSRVRQWTQWS